MTPSQKSPNSTDQTACGAAARRVGRRSGGERVLRPPPPFTDTSASCPCCSSRHRWIARRRLVRRVVLLRLRRFQRHVVTERSAFEVRPCRPDLGLRTAVGRLQKAAQVADPVCGAPEPETALAEQQVLLLALRRRERERREAGACRPRLV